MKKIDIYSLSTVGIRQHFHQDYLLHEDRTDFTGSNGSGKSIIADLFQIIFIANKKFIKFGTEGLDNDTRQIHSLPYRQNEAYSFFNIRVGEGQYIVIGICISSKVGIPLKPFVITVNSDLNLKIEDNSFSTPLKFKDFLNDSGRVQNLKELAKQLNATKKLKLTHFANSENLDAYYAFLYQKEIIPINLGVHEHLKSFATVIQSFSRASNLRLKNSKDLKDFLFESEEEDLLGEFKRHKADLIKLMRDFKGLKDRMDNVDSKQNALTDLKKRQEKFEEKKIEFGQMEFLFHLHNYENAEKNVNEIRSKLKTLKTQQDSLREEIDVLSKSIGNWEKKKELNQEKIDCLNDLMILNKELQPIVDEIQFWKEVRFTDIKKEDKDLVIDFKTDTNFSLAEIKIIFNNSSNLLEHYDSLQEVEALRIKQREKLENLKNKLSEESIRSQNLLNALNSTDENSLLHYILESGKGLSEKQEIVFSNLFHLGFEQIVNPNQGDRFIIDKAILDDKFLTEDQENNGVWLNVGRVSEFFKRKNKDRLFENPETFGREINQLKSSIESDIYANQKKLVQIARIQNGESYNKQLFEEHFDLRLTDNTKINQLKSAIVLILNKENHIKALEKTNQEKIKKQHSLLKTLKLKENENRDKLLKELNNETKKIDQQWKKYNKQLAEKGKEQAVVTTQIDNFSGQLQVREQTRVELEKEFNKVKNDFTQSHPVFDLSTIESIEVFDIEEYNQSKLEEALARKAYRNEYIEVTNSFEETKNKADVNITLQIDSDTFDFHVLESTLLGPRIKHLDKIKPEMDEMNRTRLEFVDNLYEKMIKIFAKTQEQYKRFDDKVKDLNDFFKDQKISEQYYFSIDFTTEKCLDINWIYELKEKSSEVFMKGEIPFGESADDFIEKFFQKLSKQRQKVSLIDLLNPKSYFHLSTKMEDEDGEENSGSTGETYTALVLLGIARLSLVQEKSRGGLRFVILEESANLDDTNFNIFPKIAKKYNYQIITMTPKPFGSDSTDGWYLHQLIKSKNNKNLNYPIPASYFKTKNARQKLSEFINENVE